MQACKQNLHRLVNVTPWMEGAIILCYVLPHRHKQIKRLYHCRASKTQSQALKTYICKKNKKPVTIQIKRWSDKNKGELRQILCNNERARLQKEEEKVFGKVQDIQNIKPFLEKMKQWMPSQWEI
eukprot:scaffold76306_cov40-Cyclotella_meneghiniana.AAC.1